MKIYDKIVDYEIKNIIVSWSSIRIDHLRRARITLKRFLSDFYWII